jgi:hypothetical protein
MLDPKRCPIVNQTPGRPLDIRFMKRPIENQNSQIMNFLTPDLYLQCNSSNDEEASSAYEEWERILREYTDHLARIKKSMNSRVKNFAESICLHDAELLSIQEDVQRDLRFLPFSISVAMLSLKRHDERINLTYFLWREIESLPREE